MSDTVPTPHDHAAVAMTHRLEAARFLDDAHRVYGNGGPRTDHARVAALAALAGAHAATATANEAAARPVVTVKPWPPVEAAGTPLGDYMPDPDTAADALRDFLDAADRQGAASEHLRCIAAVVNDRAHLLRAWRAAVEDHQDAHGRLVDTVKALAEANQARVSLLEALTAARGPAVPEGTTARRLDAARAVARAVAGARWGDTDALRESSPALHAALLALAVAYGTIDAPEPEPEPEPSGLCPETCPCRLHDAYPAVANLLLVLAPLDLPGHVTYARDCARAALPELTTTATQRAYGIGQDR